ncbi:MAG: hypothetical protein EZS28_015389 [Streblomastix strix]|uniref:Uncharacterized protein n=1 Tax=Streblomastix strix TaxID=222440 RepID=A0A5J4W3K2_9EUKA|nr:MAG: hypothetical protein EZS28_015389 [Streblomastix strix]
MTERIFIRDPLSSRVTDEQKERQKIINEQARQQEVELMQILMQLLRECVIQDEEAKIDRRKIQKISKQINQIKENIQSEENKMKQEDRISKIEELKHMNNNNVYLKQLNYKERTKIKDRLQLPPQERISKENIELEYEQEQLTLRLQKENRQLAKLQRRAEEIEKTIRRDETQWKMVIGLLDKKK